VENLFKISIDNEQNLKQLQNLKVSVLGAARSGIAIAKLLLTAGAKVMVSDVQPAESFKTDLVKSLPHEVEVEFGGHSQKVLKSDLICVSPGIPLTIPILKEAQKKNIPIVGELEIASWFTNAKTIAITGSNGKTTTTSLAGNIFRRHFKRVIVGGNIGSPFAMQLQNKPDPEICILEVSSFQLETIFSFHPQIAVITNLSPNHLDRYPDFDAYVAAKMNILKNLKENDIIIYNSDDLLLIDQTSKVSVGKIPFSIEKKLSYGAYWDDNQIQIQLDSNHSIKLSNYSLRGPHNRYNMVVAALLAILNNIPQSVIKNELENFSGIPHRLEEVRTINGVTFFNDSKATTVSSLKYALQSFEDPIILITGGIDKGGDFSELNELLQKKVRAAVLIGKASQQMSKEWDSIIPLYSVSTLEEAVNSAFDLAKKGDVVLLSPACSSFDMFNDYEDRGNQFKNLVMSLKESENSKMKVKQA
jgi:UDP-N-acetylmuramoylalanine--D-glutamate ligase